MKVRIRFSKDGIMQYIGHLDMMRFFQKALRRAHIDIKLTEGFSPHPVMSIAAPLGLGILSDGEYMDIEVGQAMSSDSFVRCLNEQMTEGVRVLSVRKLPDGRKMNAMASLKAASYTVSLADSYSSRIAGACDYSALWAEFMAQEEIVVHKKTKSGESDSDIKPLILDSSAKNGVFSLLLATGSSENLRPDVVMTGFLHYMGQDTDAEELLKKGLICIRRTDMFTTDDNGKLISLEEAGEIIY